MSLKNNVHELRDKVAQYRKLAHLLSTDDVTRQRIFDLIDELEHQARELACRT